MSSIKSLTEKIVSEGVANRKVRTPSGKPLRIYKRWQEQTGRHGAVVNWCHYFWVTVLWAHLLSLKLWLGRLFSKKSTWVVAAIAAIGLGVWLTVSGIAPNLWMLPLYAIGGIVVIVVGAFILSGLVAGLEALVNTRPIRRFRKWFRHGRLIRGHLSPLTVTLVLLNVAAIILSIAASAWVLVSIFVAIPIVALLGNRLSMRIAKADERRAVVVREQMAFDRIEILFALMYARICPPEKVKNSHEYRQGYYEWRRSLKEVIEGSYSDKTMIWRPFYSDYKHRYNDEWTPFVPKWVFEEAVDDYEWAIYDKGFKVREVLHEGKLTSDGRRKPSRLSVAFSYIRDFTVLIVQYIRVKKWKACPIVEIPADDQSPSS